MLYEKLVFLVENCKRTGEAMRVCSAFAEFQKCVNTGGIRKFWVVGEEKCGEARVFWG